VANYRREAVVTSNDRVNPQSRIKISGTILFVVKVEPVNLRLTGLAGSRLVGEVTVKPGTDLGIEVKEAKAQKGQFELISNEPQADGSTVLRFEAAPSELAGMLRDQLEVKVVGTDGSEHSSTVPVILDHQDRVTIQPRGNIVFQRRDTEPLKQPGAAPARRDIQLYSSSPEIEFNILEVEILDVPEGVFTHELRTVKAGGRYVVSVFLNEHQDEPSVRGRLRILTDDEKSPEKIVRVYAQFGVAARPGATVTPGTTRPPAGKPTLQPGGGSLRPVGAPPVKGGAIQVPPTKVSPTKVSPTKVPPTKVPPAKAPVKTPQKPGATLRPSSQP